MAPSFIFAPQKLEAKIRAYDFAMQFRGNAHMYYVMHFLFFVVWKDSAHPYNVLWQPGCVRIHNELLQ